MILAPGKDSLVAIPIAHGTGLNAFAKDIAFYALTHEVIKMDCSTMRLSITIIPKERINDVDVKQT